MSQTEEIKSKSSFGSAAEPSQHLSECPYCANAPTNHKVSYISSVLSILFDPHITWVANLAPKFLKKFVDFVPSVLMPVLNILGIVKFSDDIEKSVTFRSRVVWEEARRKGIVMQQVIVFGKPIESHRALINGRYRYFESLPMPINYDEVDGLWDNKSILKKAFVKNGIPVPKFYEFSVFREKSLDKGSRLNKKLLEVFEGFSRPVIVKPRVGSRGRHTTTNINTFEDFLKAIKVAMQITPYFIAEEHISGDVCRATVVDGKLVGFYRAGVPTVYGDGVQTIERLIREKNANKNERVGVVEINDEIIEYIARSGYKLDSVPQDGAKVPLTYRTGRLFGGITREMLDELHPSFVPALEKAGSIVGLVVAGFDCIVPDPTKGAGEQKWGIIECNTLPFIDLHYYALEGEPKNIAGMIWDLWNKNK
jgi:cyanophycin synthetase